ncbi:MAG: HEAT repeat domain-containing protein [Pirellulales bacterium]|jgi:HEAT repeat protein
MNSFRILGSLWALVVLMGFISGCSKPKQDSRTSSVIRTDSVEGGGATEEQKAGSSLETMNSSENSNELAQAQQDADESQKATPSSEEEKTGPVVRPSAPEQPEARELSINELREKLSAATNPDAVVKVTDSIGRLRGQGRSALPDLIKLTADADPRVRWHAARSVGLIGEDAVATIPTLLTLLQDADPVVATQAAAAIGHIREDDDLKGLSDTDKDLYADAVTQLVGTLVHNDARVRRACLRSLRTLDPTPEQLMPVVDTVFASQDPAVILPVLQSIADMGSEAVPFLVERLKLPQGRFWASVAITEIGPGAAGATQALIEALPESALDEQLHEVFALAAIGEGAQSAGDALVKLYGDGDSSLHGPILYAIGKLKYREAESVLTQTVSEESPLSATAAWALAKIHPDDAVLVDDAVKRMRAQCQSESTFEQAAAVSALSDLSASMDATQRQSLGVFLGDMLVNATEPVQEAAAAAIVRLGSDGVPAAVSLLKDTETQFVALEIISAIGESAAEVVSDIIGLLDSKDDEIVHEAILALASIGSASAPASDRVLTILNESVQNQNEVGTRLHYAAAYCLGRIGSPAAMKALPRLKELSVSSDGMQATVAIWAVLQITPDDQEQFENAVPLLTEALASEVQTIRLEAIIALGDLGPRAKDAVPAIELVSEDDPVRTIRLAAQQALEKIQAD